MRRKVKILAKRRASGAEGPVGLNPLESEDAAGHLRSRHDPQIAAHDPSVSTHARDPVQTDIERADPRKIGSIESLPLTTDGLHGFLEPTGPDADAPDQGLAAGAV
jgi:hypothetical protein